MRTIDLTPIKQTEKIIKRVNPNKLYELRFLLHTKIIEKGLKKTNEDTNINIIRLSSINTLPLNRKTTKTLLKLAQYFKINPKQFSTEETIIV